VDSAGSVRVGRILLLQCSGVFDFLRVDVGDGNPLEFATIAEDVHRTPIGNRWDRELGDRPRPFSFPWGKPKNITRVAIDAVVAAGYYAAASAYGGVNSRGGDCFRIRRVDVGNGAMTKLATRARIAGFEPDFWRLRRKVPNV